MEAPLETTQEVHLFVEFDNKIKDDAFQNDFFLRMTNLDTETPLVQVNNDLFKGHYEDCIGTNLFFKDVARIPEDCPFKEESTIHLEHTVAQFKVLALTPVRIPSKIKEIPEPEYDVEINMDYEYEELLRKLANGSLSLEDNMKIVSKGKGTRVSTPEPEPVKPFLETQPEQPVIEEKEEVEAQVEEIEVEVGSVDILTHKYEKLKRLARRPVRRKITQESVVQCEAKYQKSYEYNSLKSQVIMPSDYFPVISKRFNKETLVGAVDIDRSILQGFIEPSPQHYRILTEDEKTALLCMENMHNLSIPARYFVLKSQLEYLESLLLTEAEEKLKEKDKYGRSIEENIEIYRRLVKVVNGIIEQKYFYNSECETDDDDESDDLVMDLDPSKTETLDASQEIEGFMKAEQDGGATSDS